MQHSSSEGLQLDQDISHQRREWRIERFGWFIMSLVIVSALLGFFGGAGIFLYKTVSIGHKDIQLEYPRFGRFLSPIAIRFHTLPNEDPSSTSLWLNEQYLINFEVEQVTPTPDWVEAREGRVIYRFRGQPREVTFNLKAEKMGIINGEVGAVGSSQGVSFQQFIYP